MRETAQAAIEFLIAAVIISALLAFGFATYSQQNASSLQIKEARSSMIECNKIADAISRTYASHDIAEEKLVVSKTAQIQRTMNNPGQITIGIYSCNYFGNAAIDSDLIAGQNPEYYDTTVTGTVQGFTIGAASGSQPVYAKTQFKLTKKTYSNVNYVVFVPQP